MSYRPAYILVGYDIAIEKVSVSDERLLLNVLCIYLCIEDKCVKGESLSIYRYLIDENTPM